MSKYLQHRKKPPIQMQKIGQEWQKHKAHSSWEDLSTGQLSFKTYAIHSQVILLSSRLSLQPCSAESPN